MNILTFFFFILLFIHFEDFIPSLLQPTRLVSPDSLLKLRCGNCFEVATLLCSLLIANRYGAMIVSGYASREVTKNDQKRVICPNIPMKSSQQPAKVYLNQLFLHLITTCIIHNFFNSFFP